MVTDNGLSEEVILPDHPAKVYPSSGMASKDKVSPSVNVREFDGITIPELSGVTETVNSYKLGLFSSAQLESKAAKKAKVRRRTIFITQQHVKVFNQPENA